jgi:cyclase
MWRPRVFPTILLNGIGAIKTVQFKDPTYIGDPMNAARIYSAKEVDELALLDKMATPESRMISLDIVSRISDECFMPLTVGGGIKSLEDIRQVINAGAEKVSINSYAIENPNFVSEASDAFGSSTIVVSIDAKKTWGGYKVFTHGGTKKTQYTPAQLAVMMEELGAGEILVNSIDRDGTMQGYEIELIRQVADAVTTPVIACGGAGNLEHISDAIYEGHATAATAGSMFVFQGRKRAVLINFPTKPELETVLARQI